MKRSKNYRKNAELVDRTRLYSPLQAANLAKETGSTSRMDATVEVAMRLGVDPRKADQMVRGTVNLPHGTGKTARVIVFATGDKAAEAEAAGADVVGAEDLIERIQGGWLEFDAAIATPDQMAKVGRIARILGPRGLMPNPKTGTVTPDVTKAVRDIKGGKINFRVDKQANLHFVIGKASFPTEKLVENYGAALDEILRAKPSAAKGRYLKKVTVSTTTGPGIPVDPTAPATCWWTTPRPPDPNARPHPRHRPGGGGAVVLSRSQRRQSASTVPTSSGAAGGPGSVAGVRENRGAGAACGTPSGATTVPRAFTCGCSATSDSASTGVTHASEPSNTATHSSRGRLANAPANRARSTGHPATSSCAGSVAGSRPSPSTSCA